MYTVLKIIVHFVILYSYNTLVLYIYKPINDEEIGWWNHIDELGWEIYLIRYQYECLKV